MGMLEGTDTVATLILSGDSIHVDDWESSPHWAHPGLLAGSGGGCTSKYSRVAKTYGGRGGK